MNRCREFFSTEKRRLLGEGLFLIERLKKMRSIGATPRSIGIDPHILSASGLNEPRTEHLSRLLK